MFAPSHRSPDRSSHVSNRLHKRSVQIPGGRDHPRIWSSDGELKKPGSVSNHSSRCLTGIYRATFSEQMDVPQLIQVVHPVGLTATNS